MLLIDKEALQKEAGKLWTELPDGEELSKELMKAINHAPEVVLKCGECMFWDADSGLTARKCEQWGTFTTQNDFCSRFFKP